jgi:hypothetical protein
MKGRGRFGGSCLLAIRDERQKAFGAQKMTWAGESYSPDSHQLAGASGAACASSQITSLTRIVEAEEVSESGRRTSAWPLRRRLGGYGGAEAAQQGGTGIRCMSSIDRLARLTLMRGRLVVLREGESCRGDQRQASNGSEADRNVREQCRTATRSERCPAASRTAARSERQPSLRPRAGRSTSSSCGSGRLRGRPLRPERAVERRAARPKRGSGLHLRPRTCRANAARRVLRA